MKANDATSEEYLRRVTIGDLVRYNSPITLVEYDPHWPEQFDREAIRIRNALGDKVLRLEHVGSTSVPGLCAKPIIDMVLVVVDSSDEPSYSPALEASGYKLRIREPDWMEHRLFKGPDADINLHTFGEGASEIERMLFFETGYALTKSTETDTPRQSGTLHNAYGSTDSITRMQKARS
jgi:GrpB-like predicted nucleotidyltransferase (UPF0157 family)